MPEISCGIAAIRPGIAVMIEATFSISPVMVASPCAATASRGPAPATDVVMLVRSDTNPFTAAVSCVTIGPGSIFVGIVVTCVTILLTPVETVVIEVVASEIAAGICVEIVDDAVPTAVMIPVAPSVIAPCALMMSFIGQ